MISSVPNFTLNFNFILTALLTNVPFVILLGDMEVNDHLKCFLICIPNL